MNHVKTIGLLLIIVLCCGVSYDANGGLFFRRKCRPQHNSRIQKPAEVPFPIDEVPGDCPEGKCEPTIAPTSWTPSPEIDIDTIVKAVIEQLPPVTIQIEHPNGEVFSQSKPLGEAIRLKLVPQ